MHVGALAWFVVMSALERVSRPRVRARACPAGIAGRLILVSGPGACVGGCDEATA